ncbi:hypothetical protein DDE82_007547 [Stemphylium lycopersici]|uniref:Uncharacterized protein n=1 Tax=Stemphylium lycopersici TaxID=183478 RepID=A0A364N2Q8_STELY|nr:hypothetical protein DDE82_007547 [Stemphylium lycopersici]RAR10318.1 hypothetical protein DDE83_005089 [Stemphylium lycopersici]
MVHFLAQFNEYLDLLAGLVALELAEDCDPNSYYEQQGPYRQQTSKNQTTARELKKCFVDHICVDLSEDSAPRFAGDFFIEALIETGKILEKVICSDLQAFEIVEAVGIATILPP